MESMQTTKNIAFIQTKNPWFISRLSELCLPFSKNISILCASYGIICRTGKEAETSEFSHLSFMTEGYSTEIPGRKFEK